jgi:hypothetical protein
MHLSAIPLLTPSHLLSEGVRSTHGIQHGREALTGIGGGLGLWVRDNDLGFRVRGLGFTVYSLGLRVKYLRFLGSGFRVQGLGFRV